MNTQQQIRNLEKTLKYTTEQLEKLKNMEIEVWEPEDGEEYYYANYYGGITETIHSVGAFDNHILATGNYFQTKKGAEMHKLRLESMKRGFLPKVGEEYWALSSVDAMIMITDWDNDSTDLGRYNLGRTFKTEAEGEAWVEKYAAAWKFVEGENE